MKTANGGAAPAAWLCIAIVVWASLNALVLWVPRQSRRSNRRALQIVARACGGVLGIVTAILGFAHDHRSSLGIRSFAFGQPAARRRGARFFCPAFLRALAVARSSRRPDDGPPVALGCRNAREFLKLLRFLAGFVGLGVVMGFFINVNKFSLHAMYRNRLIRAFLGASRTARKPHWFTGFDPHDNFRVRDLEPGRPFHVINIALNLVKGGQLAWQERMAASFTVSRLHSGSWLLGYRPSLESATAFRSAPRSPFPAPPPIRTRAITPRRSWRFS